MVCGSIGPAFAPPSERTSAIRNSPPSAVAPAEMQTASARSGACPRNLAIGVIPSKTAVAPEIIRVDATRARPAVPPPVRIPEQSAPGRQPRARRHAPGERRRRDVVIGPARHPLGFAEQIAVAIGVDFAAGNEAVLGIVELSFPVEMEVLDESPRAA